MSSQLLNSMTDLINRIEDRIGLRMVNLPSAIDKHYWPTIIKRDTLKTFSIFFPHKTTVYIDTRNPKYRTRSGWYLVTDFMTKGQTLISIGDISWSQFSHYACGEMSLGLGVYDYVGNNFSLDDVGLLQMRADHTSVFQNSIFVVTERPNRVRFQTVNNRDITRYISVIPLDIMVKNYDDLSTISPGMSEDFDDLACCDIALFLYNQLKFFDGIETVFTNVDLHMDELRDWMGRRPDVVQKLRDNNVSAGNKAYNFMACV